MTREFRLDENFLEFTTWGKKVSYINFKYLFDMNIKWVKT